MLIISTQLYNYVHFNVTCLASSIIENEKLQQNFHYWTKNLHIKAKIGQNENWPYYYTYYFCTNFT